MNDTEIENEIKAKGLTAPRVTPADIEANIASECFFIAADASCMTTAYCKAGRGFFNYQRHTLDKRPPQSFEQLTICILELKNGFTVTGESACASPENFDAELGRMIARANAVAKIWPLLGFSLKQKLHEAAK